MSIIGTRKFKESITPPDLAWLETYTEAVAEETPLATIEYNGQTIAELNAGETAVIKCEEKLMITDMVVKVNKIEEPVDDSIVGTWVFKDVVGVNYSDYNSYDLVFTSNSKSYSLIKFGMGQVYFGDTDYVYEDEWFDEVNKTITVTEEPEDLTLINWLKANATKQ